MVYLQVKLCDSCLRALRTMCSIVMGRYRYFESVSVFLSVFLNVGIGVGIGIFAHCSTVLFSEFERFSRSLPYICYRLSVVCNVRAPYSGD